MFKKAILLSLLFCVTIIAKKSFASDDLSVIDIRKNIPLSDEEPTYKDFYVNGGEDAGLKKNLVITVVRSITVRDASGAHAFGEISVPVGQLRVLAVYGKLAVAREYKLLSRDENPMLEQVGIMSGDKIELKGSFVDNSKPAPPKKKVAEVTKVETPVSVAATATVISVPVVPINPPMPARSATPVVVPPAEKPPEFMTEKTANSESAKVE